MQKKKRNPKQEYVFEPILRKRKKERIDLVAYQNKILIDLLYLFYEEVQRPNPICKVQLIENSVSAHQKAAKMGTNIIKEKSIKKIDWPANFSDLYLIEDTQDQEKKMLSFKWKELRGVRKEVQEIA